MIGTRKDIDEGEKWENSKKRTKKREMVGINQEQGAEGKREGKRKKREVEKKN